MRRIFSWLAGVLVVAIIALVVVYWTPDTNAAAMRVKYGGQPSQFVDLGRGQTVHLRDEGSRTAPVLLLLHGSNADLHTWDAWTARLRDRYRIVRIDLPGHGLTGPSPTRAYSNAAFVAVVDRVATQLALPRFVLIGSSMGGGVAWHYAVAHPNRLRGLVLVDASGAPQGDDAKSPSLVFTLARTPVAREAMANITPRSLIASGLRASFYDPAKATDAMIDRYWELLRYPGNRRATIDRFMAPRAPSDAAALVRLRVPTLVMWGAADRLLDPSGARWFASRIPGARVVLYPGVGHLPMEEAADRSSADLDRWLAKLAQAGDATVDAGLRVR